MPEATNTAAAVPYGGSPGEREVVDLCRDLIRIDTSNPTSTERAAAEYVAERLTDAGIGPTVLESEPGRANVVARIPGTGPDAGGRALLVHGHLDVVPADAAEWSVPPFSGEVRDGYLWGRGAIDMKDTVAVTLATVRELVESGSSPERDIVLAFVADEEAGGRKGAGWLVEHHPELFDGITEAVGEGGGFSYQLGPDARLYPIECAQRGQAWMRLTARGRAGHGSSPNDDNAVTALAETLARIGRHRFRARLIPAVEQLLAECARLQGTSIDPTDVESSIAALTPQAQDLLGVITRNSANPTMLQAGYQINVIPGQATAGVDGRFLPGLEKEFLEEIDCLLHPAVTREFIHHDQALEVPFEGSLVEAMSAAVRAEDPAGQPVPYCNPGGTDAKHFARLGIRCFGFKGLRLPADLDYARLFHGVDERVPLEGLTFGVRVMKRLLSTR